MRAFSGGGQGGAVPGQVNGDCASISFRSAASLARSVATMAGLAGCIGSG